MLSSLEPDVNQLKTICNHKHVNVVIEKAMMSLGLHRGHFNARKANEMLCGTLAGTNRLTNAAR
jgi:hypothetical protein